MTASQTSNSSHGQPAAWIFQQLGTPLEDGRVADWPMMSSIWPTVGLLTAYLLILSVGPRLMENRKPWELKSYMVAYNFGVVLLAIYTFCELLASTFLNPKFNGPTCAPVDYSNDPSSLRLLSTLWLYFMTKCIQLSESVVFVLRKKNNQLSFLHVYHHMSMPVLWWLTVKHCGGGSAFFPPLINCAIHGVMYLYYMLAAMGEWTRPYLWWKKYITQLQLIQFWIVAIHISYSIYLDCGYPKGYQWLLNAFLVTQKVLFMNFYMKAYRKPKSAAVENNNTATKYALNGNRMKSE